MSSDKKDLTRIEDLGEFIHELNAEDEFPSDMPDIPAEEDDVPAFESSAFDTPSEESSESDSGLDFGTTEEFPSSNFEGDSSDFTTNFDSPSEENTFSDNTESSTDFGTSDFSTDFSSEEPKPEDKTDEFKTDDFKSDDFTSSEFKSDDFKTDEFKADDFKTEEPSWNTDIPLTQEIEEKTSEPQPEPVKETYKAPESVQEYKAPETFEDLKKFSESSSFSGMATEGNPSFSVLLKNVRYIEDVQDIVTLLKELNLLVDSEEQTKARLMRGMLLVPRISEYAAIFLAHKLRRFDIDIQLGLSDEIHPPKHQEAPETGIVSKYNLYQNQSHHFHFDDPKLDLSQIIVSATSQLEGYQVVRYLGVASEHKMLDGHVVEDENSSEVPAHYQELAQKLKAHALKANSNAVVGLNYQLTPLPGEFGVGGTKYRLTCTGNLVWVSKL